MRVSTSVVLLALLIGLVTPSIAAANQATVTFSGHVLIIGSAIDPRNGEVEVGDECSEDTYEDVVDPDGLFIPNYRVAMFDAAGTVIGVTATETPRVLARSGDIITCGYGFEFSTDSATPFVQFTVTLGPLVRADAGFYIYTRDEAENPSGDYGIALFADLI